jgi:sulfite reductase (NADPH) hemoprotein beta-component
MSIAAVGRIAYLTSEVLISSLPPPPDASVFAEAFVNAGRVSVHRPKLISSPSGADDGQTVLRNASNLTTLTALANLPWLTRLLPHLEEISASPVVIHLAVHGDLSDVLLLRSSIPFFLLSTTAQKAHDNALLAARLARTERKAVIHAFYVSTSASPSQELAEEQIHAFLLSTKPSAAPVNGQAENHLDPSTKSLNLYEEAAIQTSSLIKRPLITFSSRGSAEPQTVVLILGKDEFVSDVEGVLFISISLITPLPRSLLLNSIPQSTKRVIVLEQIHKWHSKWTPLYLETVVALQERTAKGSLVVQSGELCNPEDIKKDDIETLIQTSTPAVTSRLRIGVAPNLTTASRSLPHVPKHEASYTKILSQLFQDRLEISNAPELAPTLGEFATTPEFALGRVRGQLECRTELVNSVQDLLQDSEIDSELHSLLTQWVLGKEDPVKSQTLGKAVIESLNSASLKNPAVQQILSLGDLFPSRSRWIIGSDAWSYDLGASGLHHIIASGLDINILILDTLPYSSRNTVDPHRRKHDVGLYAMNHGDVYVASVAVFSSYSQVLQAIVEADKFKGPSVVLAYLPYTNEDTPAIDILKETKLSVDSGYWPLYRWDPSKEKAGKEPFSLDSDAIKNELKHFLDRQNHLSQLVRSTPEIASELVSSLGQTVKEARRKRAEDSFNTLVSSLDAPPLLVLYASDGGAAEKKAKRLAGRAKARGLTTTIATLDSYTLENLGEEEFVVFVTSTAGQGEPPQNGRTFFKSINAAVAKATSIFQKLRYSVFGMGDSHYWPRPEDAHYYNKPGKDLDARLETLGADRIAPLGLGDDQDADGSETGYKTWEPLLWKALKVDSVEITEAEPEPITNEHIKAASGYLRGTIAEGLQDFTTGALAASDTQLTKFHGIYQQDDRDIRDEREAQGAEPAYSFMIRVRMPGGVCKPAQWLQMDQIADEHGCGTFKITTRQTFQFHGVIKKHLKPAIQDINRALLDTLAACGDVNRLIFFAKLLCDSVADSDSHLGM